MATLPGGTRKRGSLRRVALVHGEPVKNVEALANPEALDDYRNRPELSC